MWDLIEFRIPVDLGNILVGALAGGVIGFGLVFLVDWSKRPRVKVLGFSAHTVKLQNSSGGSISAHLYKLHFRLMGVTPPGLCRMNIAWSDRAVLAKWDETPNPTAEGNSPRFRPELVPATFDQALFLGQEYHVPIIIGQGDKYEVFSGWWFGRDTGYGPDPKVSLTDSIQLTLWGGQLLWSEAFTLDQVCKKDINLTVTPMTEHSDWHRQETYKSLVQIANSALRFVLIANGAGATAVLAFIGRIYSTDIELPDVTRALGLFLIGVFLGGVAHFTAYMTQLRLYNEPPKPQIRYLRSHRPWLHVTIAAVLLGILSFG